MSANPSRTTSPSPEDFNGRDAEGVCTQCESPPEAYHSRRWSFFRGYYCWKCGQTYTGDLCSVCPNP